MDRTELGSLLRLLVDTGRITAAEAAAMIVRFDLGDLAVADLPVRLADMPGRLTPTELAQAIKAVAVRLTPKQAAPFLAAANRPVQTSTPPEIKAFLRNRLASHFRGDYERTVAAYTKALADGGDVAFWHKKMQLETRSYLARMSTAGHGRPLTTTEIDAVSREAIVQQGYLQRWAAEISTRRAIGNPHSEAALQARTALYQGAGWQAYWTAAETAQTLGKDGTIVHYIAQDDGRTCDKCLNAQNGSPYAAGTEYPRPGSGTCRGFGHCRCSLRFEFNMARWQELTA